MEKNESATTHLLEKLYNPHSSLATNIAEEVIAEVLLVEEPPTEALCQVHSSFWSNHIGIPDGSPLCCAPTRPSNVAQKYIHIWSARELNAGIQSDPHPHGEKSSRQPSEWTAVLHLQTQTAEGGAQHHWVPVVPGGLNEFISGRRCWLNAGAPLWQAPLSI